MISQIIILMLMLLADQICSSPPPPHCPTTCGNVTIPFPFGTRSDCYLDESFFIMCNYSSRYPKPFLSINVEVLDVSLDGQIRVSSSVASDCYDTSGAQVQSTISELIYSNFLISSTRNRFTAVGCDTYALFEGSDQERKHMSAGCVSWCDDMDSVANGTCNGIGCCQASIPKGVRNFAVDIRSFRNHTRVKSFNPCGYAFMVESDVFEFSTLDLKDFQKRKSVPVVLEWSVGSVTCREAMSDRSTYGCRAKQSECSDSSNGIGYNCNCLTGFEGNPYLVDGCHDIDECATLKPCEDTCKNSQGSYSCLCPKGFEGDGKKHGDGCRHSEAIINGSTMFYIVSGFMVPAVGSSWIFWRRKQKKVMNLRKKLFHKNGGKLLENMLSSQKTLAIFMAEDLKKATDNYNENRVLYRDQPSGFSYKGTLPDHDGSNRRVTITMYAHVDDRNIEIFITKLVGLSRISHRNFVKLIGCCLETPVPLLVYEFITVKTLYDHIHDNNLAQSLTWDIRLRIASETAGALAYIHSDAGVQIVHGNLSSSSILLHHGYTVKIRDFALPSDIQVYFGASGLLSSEYLFSGQILTVKSDVYSFGVILAELLTGKEVIGSEGEHDLVQCLVSLPSGNDLIGIVDDRIDIEGKIKQAIQVAKLAQRCLSDASGQTMREVAIALENVMSENSCTETILSQGSVHETTARRAVRRNRSF